MNNPKHARLVELAVFALLAALMFASRFALQMVHGLHPLTLIVAACTLVWRKQALILIYLYVAIELIAGGFFWAWPYLYIFLPFWGAVMFWAWLFGRYPNLPKALKAVALMFTCGMFGMTFGLLYAPAQLVIMRSFNLQALAAWVIAGLPFDAMHAAHQFALGILVLPMAALLEKLRNRTHLA